MPNGSGQDDSYLKEEKRQLEQLVDKIDSLQPIKISLSSVLGVNTTVDHDRKQRTHAVLQQALEAIKALKERSKELEESVAQQQEELRKKTKEMEDLESTKTSLLPPTSVKPEELSESEKIFKEFSTPTIPVEKQKELIRKLEKTGSTFTLRKEDSKDGKQVWADPDYPNDRSYDITYVHDKNGDVKIFYGKSASAYIPCYPDNGKPGMIIKIDEGKSETAAQGERKDIFISSTANNWVAKTSISTNGQGGMSFT